MTKQAKPTWGGKRAGAGRPKTGNCVDVPHRARPEVSREHPLHVVLRVMKDRRASLKSRATDRALQDVLERYVGRADFRVVQIAIQNDELHLLVEANHRRALTRGMQSFVINSARAINQDRAGKVFAHRYQATPITTARHARELLASLEAGGRPWPVSAPRTRLLARSRT